MGPNGSTGFALLRERLLGLYPYDAEQVDHLAIKVLTDFGHLGDVETAERGTGPVHCEDRVAVGIAVDQHAKRLAPAGQDLLGPGPQGGLQERPEADSPDAQWTE